MIELSANAFLWVKALHMISLIAWMAGLFYLPRLYVYHTQAEAGSERSETFKVMERRLLWAIMHPALVASLIFGGLLLANLDTDSWTEGWLIIKVLCLTGLVVFHLMLGSWRVAFAEDRNSRSEKFYRMINEVPTVLMIVIVIMAVVRPF
ncbi:MAG: protoporphyrinogen oxidase HemJ [Rhodospirillales bacterium]|nr:protoporphyrinogen oxidase HemJ [Rhodospirillales bacterium]